MKFIRKCPFLILLLSTGLLFTIIGLGGLKNIYAAQEYDPVKSPVLSVMFTALNDDIYPWQIFAERGIMMVVSDVREEVGDLPDKDRNEEFGSFDDTAEKNDGVIDKADEKEAAISEGKIPSDDDKSTDMESPAAGVSGNAISDITAISDTTAIGDVIGSTVGEAISTAMGDTIGDNISAAIGAAMEETEENPLGITDENSSVIFEGRPEPLRESTREEYLNHISADIYGDAGVKRAAEYGFTTVDESYFDDALFIGDSRTVGLRDYTDLSEHADFYCETSLTIYKVLEQDFKGLGTVEEALVNNSYGKIYIMVGVNELGRGTTEDFMGEYTRVVDRLHELAPEAKIFIQGIMRVTGKKHNSDAIFNNNNINARNNAIATLADNNQFFYIDVNEAICDEEGNLNAEYTHDQLHLLGMYNDLWKEFLMTRGVQ